MIGVKIQVTGLKEWGDKLHKMPDNIQRGLRNAIVKSSLVIEGKAKILVSGEMVKVQTGRLRTSINTQLNGLSSTVSTNINYAIYVHDGTRFITPRPFMFEAANRSLDEINDIFNHEIEKAIAK